MKYEIVYDFTESDGYECRNIREDYTGTWMQLQEYIKVLRKNGCYNISVGESCEEETE